METDLLIVRVVHILASAVWVGGTVFIVAVAVPYARSFGPERSSEIAAAIGRRFRPLGWTALIALVTTGLYTMSKYDLLSITTLTRTAYGKGLLIKLVMVAVILVLGFLHDFILGPRVERRGASRRLLLVFARTNGVLTLVVPVIGVLLAH